MFKELDMCLKWLSPDSVTPEDLALAAYGRRKREASANNLLRDVFYPHIAKALHEGMKAEKLQRSIMNVCLSFFWDIGLS